MSSGGFQVITQHLKGPGHRSTDINHGCPATGLINTIAADCHPREVVSLNNRSWEKSGGRTASSSICVALSVKCVWAQRDKKALDLISFSRVSFRIWGLCLRGVSDLPLAPPQCPILSSILPLFLCFSSLPFIAFSLRQSLEISKYLSTLHLCSGVTAHPQSCPSFPPRSLIMFSVFLLFHPS